MKLLYIFLLLPFFSLQADNQDYSKIETIIDQNSHQLEQPYKTSKEALDKKRALDLATDIQANKCPKHIDKNIMSLVIGHLVVKNPKIDKAQESFDCLESAGFNKETYYTAMVDLLISWKSDNKMFELFYTRFFKGYKNPHDEVLGLLDNAIIMCANNAISYLEKNEYPSNYNKAMTETEYSMFLDYIKSFRCEGY